MYFCFAVEDEVISQQEQKGTSTTATATKKPTKSFPSYLIKTFDGRKYFSDLPLLARRRYFSEFFRRVCLY
jgi:hypothetical protein